MHITEAYKILGLDPSKATDEDIKKAQKKLMVKYHPDVNKDPHAEVKFKQVNQAVQTIEEHKSMFEGFNVEDVDMDFESFFKANGPVGFGGFDPSIFTEIFGSGPANPFNRSPFNPHFNPNVRVKTNCEQTLEIPFKEAMLGCTRTLSYERRRACEECSGTGVMKKGDLCPVCQGKGIRMQNQTMGNATLRVQTTCNACRGSGHVLDNCMKCAGAGSTVVHERKEIHFPPGIETGQKAVQRGLGNYLPNGQYGSLVISLIVLEDENYMRLNNDIHLIKHVSLLDALRGREVDVVSLTGKKHKVVLPKEIKNADVVRVSDEGVPNTEGSFCLRVMVDYPKGIKSVEKLIGLLEKEEK